MGLPQEAGPSACARRLADCPPETKTGHFPRERRRLVTDRHAPNRAGFSSLSLGGRRGRYPGKRRKSEINSPLHAPNGRRSVDEAQPSFHAGRMLPGARASRCLASRTTFPALQCSANPIAELNCGNQRSGSSSSTSYATESKAGWRRHSRSSVGIYREPKQCAPKHVRLPSAPLGSQTKSERKRIGLATKRCC